MKRASDGARRRAAGPARRADAAPKRVVAIEWDTVENLHMLGMAPVGAADMKGYDTWVAAPRPKGMKDVGSRQSPSIERIAALKPDLIVVPDYRSTKNLSQLKRIAPVLVTHPYPATRQPVQRDGHRLPAARRRRSGASSRGERVLQDLSNTLARDKAKLARARRRSARGDRDARRHDQRARDPHVHARTRRPLTWSAASACKRRLDRQRALRLRDGRPRGAHRASTAGSRSCTRRSSQRQVAGITKTVRLQAAAGREGQARAHARRHDVAVRRPALDDAVRRPLGGGADVAMTRRAAAFAAAGVARRRSLAACSTSRRARATSSTMCGARSSTAASRSTTRSCFDIRLPRALAGVDRGLRAGGAPRSCCRRSRATRSPSPRRSA